MSEPRFSPKVCIQIWASWRSHYTFPGSHRPLFPSTDLPASCGSCLIQPSHPHAATPQPFCTAVHSLFMRCIWLPANQPGTLQCLQTEAGGRFWRPKVLQETGKGGIQGTSLQQGLPLGLQSIETNWRQSDLCSESLLQSCLP